MGAVPADPVGAGFSAPGDSSAARLQQLAHVTAMLAAAESVAEVASVVVDSGAEAIDAAVATLLLVEGDDIVLAGAHGIAPGIETRFARFGIADANPASQAVRERRPVVLQPGDDIEHRYPTLSGTMPPGRSLIALPLLAGGQALGAVGLTFNEGWTPGDRELDFLTTFADACAQAVRRVRATEQSLQQAAHLRFLADASAALATDLDYSITLTHVAQLAVPDLADWCTVTIDRGGELETMAVAHVDPTQVEWARQLQAKYPVDRDSPRGVAAVVRTGVSELVAEITDEMLTAAARDEEHLAVARSLRLRSAMVVPLTARNRVFGALTFYRTVGRAAFTEADLAMADDLGRRAGVAIDNAILFSQAQDVALHLQHALLPDDLADTFGGRIATYFSPGGNVEVGGDFYDAIALDDGRIAVFIGDVMGHGIRAAAAMAQIRASVRAYLSVDPTPAVVAAKLGMMFQRLHIRQLITLIYAVIDPAEQRITLVNAGHYPPVLVPTEGEPRFIGTKPQRPFGAGRYDRCETTASITPGDTLLLYTDGLVERRDEDISDGLARLAEHALVLAQPDLPAALKSLVSTLQDPGVDDDVTALALRVG